MTTARIRVPEKLLPVFAGEADVRGARGGRGSAKTRTFAKMALVKTYMFDMAGRKGIILCGRQFMNSLDDSSLLELKLALEDDDMEWLRPYFDVGEKYIKTTSGNIEFKFAGLDRNLGSVKGKSRILLCWVDEAEYVTEAAWVILIPTIREDDSELWVTWNPASKHSATHKRFVINVEPDRMKIVVMNWRDNPWFPKKLNRERLSDQKSRPEQYDHIWEGDFVTVNEGAYYARHISKAKIEKRIGANVPMDPLMTVRAVWDIGGTGKKADATAIWICQYVDREIRFLDYYEARHQPLATHINWLKKNGYEDAHCVLPHDGKNGEKVFDVSYESSLQSAGFSVEVIPNQGTGAAMTRVERARRLFPMMWFDKKCEAGLDAIGWYHEKIDEERGIGLGPDHDWSSHGADAFGLAAVAYEDPVRKPWNSTGATVI